MAIDRILTSILGRSCIALMYCCYALYCLAWFSRWESREAIQRVGNVLYFLYYCQLAKSRIVSVYRKYRLHLYIYVTLFVLLCYLSLHITITLHWMRMMDSNMTGINTTGIIMADFWKFFCILYYEYDDSVIWNNLAYINYMNFFRKTVKLFLPYKSQVKYDITGLRSGRERLGKPR